MSLAFAVAWIGHAYILTSLLNNLYGRPLPKALLKPWRFLTGVCILAFPFLLLSGINPEFNFVSGNSTLLNGVWGYCVVVYAAVCPVFGVVYFFVNLVRYLRKPPACLLREETRTLDLWPEYGEKLIGDGKGRIPTRLPGTCGLQIRPH